jgi:hypothetical protein
MLQPDYYALINLTNSHGESAFYVCHEVLVFQGIDLQCFYGEYLSLKGYTLRR